MHISEVNQVMQQLVSQRFALQQISQLLGPYTIAAKGNPVDAAGRCFNAAEALRKKVVDMEHEHALEISKKIGEIWHDSAHLIDHALRGLEVKAYSEELDAQLQLVFQMAQKVAGLEERLLDSGKSLTPDAPKA